MYLSKSIYVQVWNCPKGAWIQKYHPEMITVSPDQQARFDAGHEVGELAQGVPCSRVTASVYACYIRRSGTDMTAVPGTPVTNDLFIGLP